MSTFLLVHSPLVGPYTWFALAEKLRHRGYEVVVPHLRNDAVDGDFWQEHVRQAVAALDKKDEGIVLVGHSGGGGLLPVIGAALTQPVLAYAFLDALIPQDGRSRLELFETPEAADQLRAAAVDGFLPTWTEEDLQDSILDAGHRRNFVAELEPMPLAVYEEALPVPADRPDEPCYYLQFTPIYDQFAQQAGKDGWQVERMPGTHFHLLDRPVEVVEALLVWLGNLDKIWS